MDDNALSLTPIESSHKQYEKQQLYKGRESGPWIFFTKLSIREEETEQQKERERERVNGRELFPLCSVSQMVLKQWIHTVLSSAASLELSQKEKKREGEGRVGEKRDERKRKQRKVEELVSEKSSMVIIIVREITKKRAEIDLKLIGVLDNWEITKLKLD